MSKPKKLQALIAEADEKLSAYRRDHSGLSWRQKVLLLVEIAGCVKELGKQSNPNAARVHARERIRLYLTEHVGVVIAAAELEVVSGISEYARRIRELRVEDGYKILTGYSNDPESGVTLKPSEYLLLEVEPDHTAARRWKLANRIRNEQSGGSRGRLLQYFLENVGQVVTSEELRYVAKASEFGRRIRELRTEEGYPISTRFTGRPDLKMGEYVMESSERIADPHDRKIPLEVQKVVYERADNACQLCGWNRSRWKKSDPRILELHHVAEYASGGSNTPENLVVLCSRCHDEIHAGRSELPPDLIR